MNKNMPCLWQNALLQFKTEIGRKAWIWYAESTGSGMQYSADRFAREVENLALRIEPMLALANKHHNASDEVINELLRFILTRHANWRLGGNAKPPYLQINRT